MKVVVCTLLFLVLIGCDKSNRKKLEIGKCYKLSSTYSIFVTGLSEKLDEHGTITYDLITNISFMDKDIIYYDRDVEKSLSVFDIYVPKEIECSEFNLQKINARLFKLEEELRNRK